MSSPARGLRTILTPKWLALTLVLLLAIAACIMLGRWQWQRTSDILAAEAVAAAAPVGLEQVSVRGEELSAESIGRPVVAEGEFAGAQVLVLHRMSDAGEPGSWVLASLELDDGSIIGIIRGWIPGGVDPPPPPVGRVRLSGILHPPEPFYPDAVTAPGTAVAISDQVMSSAWGAVTRTGFLVLTNQLPSSSRSGLQSVSPTVRTGDVAFPLQNFFYAFQWWIFALFAIVLYARWLWLDLRDGEAHVDTGTTGSVAGT